MPSLVITIPIYKRELSYYEECSFNQLIAVCGHYPIRFFCPESLDISYYQLKTQDLSDVAFDRFDDIYFSNVSMYSKLCLSPIFYGRYLEYDFLLIYQFDAFIFKDDLMEWCKKGYDYIGSPFFFKYVDIGKKATYAGVGNGGFSLRKVSSMYKMVTNHYRIFNWEKLQYRISDYNWKGKLKYYFYYLMGFLGRINTTHYKYNHIDGFEDIIIGFYAKENIPWLNIPGYEEALKFGFEFHCEKMHKDNNYQLPTGCHRWWGEDKSFWIPIMKKYNIDLK